MPERQWHERKSIVYQFQDRKLSKPRKATVS
jgi:hypothetical protein